MSKGQKKKKKISSVLIKTGQRLNKTFFGLEKTNSSDYNIVLHPEYDIFLVQFDV